MRRYVDLHMSAITGDRQAANQAAGWFDALPVGQTILAAAVTACRCGAPFDLEATPVFTRRLEEAGFSWPPADLVKYPAMQR
jgi:hypothetical protein